jgi:predicted adenylyl cyclase CyaB
MTKKILAEIKARYDDLEKARAILRKLDAEYIGRFRQIDTYFLLGEKRLKLREVEGDEYKLVYYERPYQKDIKTSNVIISRVVDGNELRMILEKVLGVEAVVDKIREIYKYRGVQIHLDEVKSLGRFIEFEKDTDRDRLKEDLELLDRLIDTLEIDRNLLIEGSYSDLILSNNK